MKITLSDPCQIILCCFQTHGPTQLEMGVSLAQITENVKETPWQGVCGGGPGIKGYDQELYYHVHVARSGNPMRINSLLNRKAALPYRSQWANVNSFHFLKRVLLSIGKLPEGILENVQNHLSRPFLLKYHRYI